MTRSKIPAVLLAAALLSLGGHSAWADDKLDFHGYFRTGTGMNSEGGDQVCFKLPGARSKYRYGNECETYSELVFGYQAFRGDDGAYFDIKTNLAYLIEGDSDFDGGGAGPNWKEVYAEGGNFFGDTLKGAKFWIGKRFYDRHDVHISDFFYWDMSGTGGGIKDVELGPGKFAYAYFHTTDDEYDATGHKIAVVNDRSVSRHDFRLSGIDVNKGGELTIGGDLRFAEESQDGFDGKDGYMITVEHHQADLWGGFNKVAVQYGSGSAHTLAANSDDTNEDGRTWRIVEQLLVEPNADWSAMGTVLYEERKDTGDDGEWLSYGGRFKYYLSEHVNLVLDAGHDQFRPDTGATRQLDKIAAAVQLSAGRTFWSRPSLRLFATYANWNDAARDAVDGVAGGTSGVFGDGTDGWSMGLQAEHWW